MSFKNRHSHRWPDYKTWVEWIDFTVRLFNLNPDLPEIRQLRQGHKQYKQRDMDPLLILKMLNPDVGVRKNIDGSIFIDSRVPGQLLKLESLVQHHLLYHRITMIEASNRSIMLYAPDGRLLAEINGTAVDPAPHLDPNQCYRDAYRLLEALTGILLQSQEYFQRHQHLSFNRKEDGFWSLKVTTPALA